MPVFIDRFEIAGGVHYSVPNPTTQGENFAEKWNTNPALAHAFYSWLEQAEADLRRLEEQSGTDARQQFLGRTVGADEARRVLAKQAAAVDRARQGGSLFLDRSPGVSSVGALAVPRNTFYGR